MKDGKQQVCSKADDQSYLKLGEVDTFDWERSKAYALEHHLDVEAV